MSDVARLAGVSVGTVSNVLNANQTVSAERTRAVVEAVQVLGYRPNGLARALVAQRQTARPASAQGRPRLVTVGRVCIDHVISLAQLPAPGSRTTSRTILKVPGGSAANIAVFAAAIGEPFVLEVDLVTELGQDDDGLWAVNALAERSVSVDSAGLSNDSRLPHAVLLVEDDGQRTIIDEPPTEPLSDIEDRLLSVLSDGYGTVLFDSLHIDHAVALAPRLRKRDCRIVFDAAGLASDHATLDELVGVFDLVFLDKTALRALGVLDAGGIEKALTTEETNSSLGVIVIEDGGGKAMLHRPGLEPLRASPPNVNVVDSTGAYDAFVGVFLASWLCQGDLEIAQRHAVRGGGLSVSALGAQGRLAKWPDLASVSEQLLRGA